MAPSPSLGLLVVSFLSLSTAVVPLPPSSLIEELNRPPPPEFPATVADNCHKEPLLRYCNSATTDTANIFKSMVVARHLCQESNNSDCALAFAKIDLRSRPRLAPLYLSFAFFWKYCPQSVLSIDLSNNSLGGSFPLDVLQCSQIHALDVSHNKLVGEAPLEQLVNLTNLSFLNLSCNRFSEGDVREVEFFKRFNLSSFLHAGLLPEDHHHGFKVTASVLLLVAVLLSVVSMIGFFGCVLVQRPDLLPSVLQRRGNFTTATLQKATNSFSDDNLLSEGERGSIYRGTRRSEVEVEIHMQKGKVSEESRKAFASECRVLLQLRHRNLIKVIGWCEQRELRAIVIERTGVCTVEEWLTQSPPWKERLKVLIGVTDGICYLQEQWPHLSYELRTRNVLLTAHIEPLISKFKVGHQENQTKKSYRFGLFLLELVTSKKRQEATEGDESGFIEWVRLHHQGHPREITGEMMKVTSTGFEQIKRIIDIGLLCVDLSAKVQPSIDQISRLIHEACSPAKVHTMHGHGHSLQRQTRLRSMQH